MNSSFSGIGLVLFASVVAAPCQGAPPTLDTYRGKWEVELVDTGTTFGACSLDIGTDSGQLGGEWSGELVWRWGSVAKLKSGESGFRLGPSGELLVARDEWSSPLALRRFGDTLQGKVTQKDGKIYTVFGRAARETVDVSGAWDIRATTPDGERKAVLKLRSDGAGWVQAQIVSDKGADVKVEEARLSGRSLALTLALPKDDGGTRRIGLDLNVKGDRLEGQAIPVEGEKKDPVKVVGERRRGWGAPVSLLKQSSLEGWKPRDASLKFGWKCENGVLENGEHDQDIVSEAQFQDFKLHVEFKVDKGGNSGVYLRGRYEVQILDDYGQGVESHGMGAVYSRIPQSKNASKPYTEWQTYDITLIGRYLTIVLNGETIADNVRLAGITGGARDPHEAEPGPLMLQGDHGKILFRNVTATPALND